MRTPVLPRCVNSANAVDERLTSVPHRRVESVRILLLLSRFALLCLLPYPKQAFAAAGFTDMGAVRTMWIQSPYVLTWRENRPGERTGIALWQARRAAYTEISYQNRVIVTKRMIDEVVKLAIVQRYLFVLDNAGGCYCIDLTETSAPPLRLEDEASIGDFLKSRGLQELVSLVDVNDYIDAQQGMPWRYVTLVVVAGVLVACCIWMVRRWRKMCRKPDAV